MSALTGSARRRIVIFTAISISIATFTGGLLSATGGLESSPEIFTGITLATILLPTVYMFSPAIANIATRVLTGEGWSGLRLWPNIRDHWWAYVAAWLGTSILVGAGFGLYVALKLVGLVSAPASTQAQLSLVELALTLTLSPLINTFVAVGEEFGWRAYLLRKLEPMGIGRALVIHGLIWGVWHWPLITLGYNYGFNYPAAPWGGLVVMSIATVAIGTVIGTAALLADSVWPAALAHGTLNAVGSIGVLVSGIGIVAATPVALVGVIPWAIVAVVLLSRADRISDEPAGTCGTLDHAVVGES